jgi:4-diphosphocytidyl-2-C-methyl-D-erythritol kinase
MSTAIRSRAKINLGLFLGASRSDGFHSLTTVYQTLEIHDVVTITARRAPVTALRLTSNDSRVPTDSRNTAWKMILLALEEFGVTAEAEIHIDKRLPVQGGLGAGSGNAVAALVGLEAELRTIEGLVCGEPGCEQPWLTRPADFAQCPGLLPPDWDNANNANWPARALDIAAKVGSDVPLFLVGGAVMGRDRGQILFPLPDIEPVWCVVAIPEIGVSTPQAFRDWDVLCAAEGLTDEASEDRLEELSRAYASAFQGAIPEGGQGIGSSGVLAAGEDLAGPQESALVRTGITSWIENDFERVIFPQHPSLAEIKRLLAGTGTPEAALFASLSGSGSALFGLYKSRGDAEAAQDRLRQVPNVEARITRTLPRAGYWSQMLVE